VLSRCSAWNIQRRPVSAAGILKPVLRLGLHSLGGISLFRSRHKHEFRILMYHNFVEAPSDFRRQCEHIRQYYNPVSMKEIGEALRDGSPLPLNAVAVTVDDGYRDFYLNAYPVLREFGIPATVFLVSEFLDGKLWLWWNQVTWAFENTRAACIDLQTSTLQHTAKWDDPATCRVACETTIRRLKSAANEDRLAAMQQLLDQLSVDLPEQPPEQWRPLSWDEVRVMSEDGMEFGAHTKTHPILSSVSDVAQLTEEIVGSRTRIEQELGKPVEHFCYPNGKGEDIGTETVSIVRNAGFLTAVTAEPGRNREPVQDPMQLKRLSAEPDLPAYYFDELLSGVRVV
jgi:peptidoglycan/xylan/chitin deacetylase (PgdA/CDA1 family)